MCPTTRERETPGGSAARRAAIIETHALTRRFGGKAAVDAVNLVVDEREGFALLGRNGAGKTTLMKMLTTLLPPTSGSATVAGFDIVRDPDEVRRSIGYVPQLVSADGILTGYENLLIFAKLYDIPGAERQKRIQDALDFMGLADASDKLVRDYSGGMIRRLEIAQSTLHRPRVVFLDEPTVGLDPLARHAVWEHIEELRAEYHTTIFLNTHDMEEADRLCSRVAIMQLGKVLIVGTPAELKAATGVPDATLSDVFVHYTLGTLDEEGGYRDTQQIPRAAHRLG